MTDGIGTFVHHPTGPISSGPGAQHNYFTVEIEQMRKIFRPRDPRRVAEEDLEWRYHRFLEPPNYVNAGEVLRDKGTVVLTGERGIGKQSAAMTLLHDLEGAPIQWLSDELEPTERDILPHHVEPGDRLLLDLTGSTPERCQKILSELSSFRARMSEPNAHLVIVMPPHLDDLDDTNQRRLRVQLQRAEGRKVLARHLHAGDVEFDRSDLLVVQEFLDFSPMRDIAELARLIECAREADSAAEGFSTWLTNAYAALTKRGGEVARIVSDHKSGPQRALLFSMAMLDGAHLDAVFRGAAHLLNLANHPADPRSLLDREDCTEALASLGTGIRVDRDGHVAFEALAYDSALRSHFWANFGGLREDFRRWVDAVIRWPGMSHRDRTRLVDRFGERSLDTDRRDDLISLVELWTSDFDAISHGCVPYAVRLLQHGLDDERHGSFFREQTYEWSRTRNLPPQLTRVIVYLCTYVMSATHPAQALVRLHHIARRAEPNYEGDAFKALAKLVDSDDDHYTHLLHRIATKLEITGWDADFALFLMLADARRLIRLGSREQPLINEPTVREYLAMGWFATMARGLGAHWRPVMRRWLTAQTERTQDEHLLDILVGAARGSPKFLGTLFMITQDWARESVEGRIERGATLDRIFAKINQAQGMDVPTGTVPTTAGEH